MRIIVLGAGAIGSFYGAKLSKLNDVLLVGKTEHVEKINKSGLRVIGLDNNIYRLKAETKIDEIGDESLILLTTKVQDSRAAITGIKKLLKKDTIIMCLQNGLYSENIVRRIIGKKCMVLRAVTNFGAIFLKPGVVSYTAYSYTSIEKNPKSNEIAENFSRCGLNAHVSNNIKHDVWKKLVLNCMLNPVTAILKIENSGICDARLNPLKRLISDECRMVAEREGIKFDFDFVEKANKDFRYSRNVSSMQQDLIKGKKTEIDHLNGAVAELGKKLGVMCPVNEALAEIISHLEEKRDNSAYIGNNFGILSPNPYSNAAICLCYSG
ncbi:2-dehydropantoate 2-reductase [Candidatus Woesearchaeota archaeon]|nr:2-dehydropantoate 2-reductase [Candidatus Woesearchaeota archaeon]